MSKSVHTDDSTEKEINKTVTIVGYLKNQKHRTLRGACDSILDVNMFEKERWSTTKRFIFNDGEEVEVHEDEVWDALQSSVENQDILIEREVTDDGYMYSTGKLSRSILDDVVDNVGFSDVDIGDYEYSSFGSKWRDDDGDMLVSIYKYTDTLGLIKHLENIDPDDPWEDEDAELYAVKYRVKYIEANEDQVKEVDEKIVEPFYRELSKLDCIGRVRMLDCEVETKEKGVCFNI